MKKSTSKRQAQAIVLAALNDLEVIRKYCRDKDIHELMLAISAIGGAFEDGWLAELIPSIEAMVSIKRPDLAELIEAKRKQRNDQ